MATYQGCQLAEVIVTRRDHLFPYLNSEERYDWRLTRGKYAGTYMYLVMLTPKSMGAGGGVRRRGKRERERESKRAGGQLNNNMLN